MKTKINLSEKVSKIEAASMLSVMGGVMGNFDCKIWSCGSPQGKDNYIATNQAHSMVEEVR